MLSNKGKSTEQERWPFSESTHNKQRLKNTGLSIIYYLLLNKTQTFRRRQIDFNKHFKTYYHKKK